MRMRSFLVPTGRPQRRPGPGRIAALLALLLALTGALPAAALATHKGQDPAEIHVLTAGVARLINGRKDYRYVKVGRLTQDGASAGRIVGELFALYNAPSERCAPGVGELFVYLKMATPGTFVRTVDDASQLELFADLNNTGSEDPGEVLAFLQGPVRHPARTGIEFSVCYASVDSGQGIGLRFRFSEQAEVNAGRLGLLIGAASSSAVGMTIATPTAPPPPPPSGTFVGIAPVRVLDTRNGTGLHGKFKANNARTFDVGGEAGIPADAIAITGNVTIVGQDANGYVSLLPEELDATETPPVSNLNAPRGDVRANNVVVLLAADGTLVAVFKAIEGRSAHVILDVTGYFVPDTVHGRYVDLSPARILDSRINLGVRGAFRTGIPKTFQVRGRGGVPNDPSVVAITGNLTVAGQTGKGFASLTTDPLAVPTTSTINFPLGDVRANGVVARLGSDGRLAATVRVGTGRAHLILDVTGYFVEGTGGGTVYHPIDPVRALDSRSGVGLPGPFGALDPRSLPVTAPAVSSVPAGAVAVTGNITVVEQTAGGYESVTRTPPSGVPTTSTLNFPFGDIRANGIVAPLDVASGSLALTYAAWRARPSTHLVLDVTGYFQ